MGALGGGIQILKAVFTLSAGPFIRNRQIDPHAALRPVRVLEREAVLVIKTKPGQSVCKPYAEWLRAGSRGPRRAIVGERKAQLITLPVGAEANLARVQCAGGPMPDRVLKKRLQQQLRHFRGGCFGLDIVVQYQAVAQPELFNTQIEVRKFQFFSQAADGAAGILPVIFQGEPEKIAERNRHAPRRGRLLDDKSGDGVQRVEQKMRM